MMSRSLDEILMACNRLLGDLAEATFINPEVIRTTIERQCGEWSEREREDVLRIAEHTASHCANELFFAKEGAEECPHWQKSIATTAIGHLWTQAMMGACLGRRKAPPRENLAASFEALDEEYGPEPD